MKTSTIALIFAVVLVGVAAWFYYQSSNTALVQKPAPKTTSDDEGVYDPCKTNYLVTSGLVTLADCQAKNQAEMDQRKKQEDERIEGEQKRKREDKALGLLTAGVSKLFPNWHK